ncbi:MAG: SIS domain-containing protein [Proteobacteria bacterium]|nr:SIS domain-containing protein [Pseudomonadota bacterium]
MDALAQTPALGTVDGYLSRLQAALARLRHEELEFIVDSLLDAWRRDAQVFICGNGGSAATASHFVCDLGKGTITPGLKRMRALSLSDAIPMMTAWGNDSDYSDIFAEQLANLMNAGDLLIAISGSGNSPNVLKAVEYARAHGGKTIALTGFAGGKIKDLAGHSVIVGAECIQIVEDVHMAIEHTVCMSLTQRFKTLAAS